VGVRLTGRAGQQIAVGDEICGHGIDTWNGERGSDCRRAQDRAGYSKAFAIASALPR
jgi:hypothetical protein